MSRTTVSVDDDLLRDASQALGTRGISETVNAALAAAVRQAKRAAFDVRRFDSTDDDVVAVGADQFRL